MTVLAWDGKMLAADKQSTCGDAIAAVTKIFRWHGHGLLGITGNFSMGMEMMQWLRDGGDPATFRSDWRDPDKGPCLLYIRLDGTCLKFESSPVPFEVEGPLVTAGCGMSPALALLNAGLCATEAVEGTSAVLNSCGMGVDFLYLHVLEN